MKAFLCIALFAVAVSAVSQQSRDQFVNDNNVLNYALTLENFEAALYEQGLAYFGLSDANYTASGLPAGTFSLLQAIAIQERAHANTLTNVLNARGYPAAPSCVYDFKLSGFANARAFVDQLAAVEHIGTQAYDGAARALTNKYLLTTAATIATVEARHTATLQYLKKANPFGGGDGGDRTVPFTQQQAFDAIKGNIVSCPIATLSVGYLNNSIRSVQSSDLTTYTWRTAAVVRGASAAATGLDQAENDANVGFYWGTSGAVNATNLFSDAKVLNYALTLENLEAAFYAQFNLSYTVAAIKAATGVSDALAASINQYITLIGTHESSHVQFLSSSLGAAASAFLVSPAQFNISQACVSYNWTALAALTGSGSLDPNVPNFTNFLLAAIQLESTGVAAYDGAIASITNSYLTTVAATIATVEAEHTAYLIQLNQNSATLSQGNGTANAFPNTIDTTQSITQVLTALTATHPVIGTACVNAINPAANLPTSNGPANFYNDGGNGNDGQETPALNNGTVTTGGGQNTNNGGNTTASGGNSGNGNSASAAVLSAAVVFAAAVFVF